MLIHSLCSTLNLPLAYIGPGADVALIGSLIGLLLTLGSSALFLVLMPLRAMLRKFRGVEQPMKAEAGTNPEC